MRRLSIFLTIVSMALIFCIPGAQAVSINAGDRITINEGPGDFPGGAFWVDILGNGTNNTKDFVTFCVEYNEHFTPGTIYTVTGISDSATFGGGGAVNGADPISDQTRWLYYHYVTGDLTSYDTSLMKLSADDLGTAMQKAIWLLENEITSADNLANGLIALASAQIGVGNKQGLDQVVVLNLNYTVGSTVYTVQDQLGLHTPAPVPEPATILLLGSGLLGAKLASTRRRKRQ